MSERPKRGRPAGTLKYDAVFPPFRVSKEVATAFKEECYKAETYPATMLRELMIRWVNHRRKT